MNPMKNSYEMDIKSLDVTEIKSISVKITCKRGEMKPKIGTGTLILDNSTYYVMTAAHCIYYLKSATIIQYTIKGRFMSR